MSGADFKVDLLKYGYINYDTQTMIFPGNIIAESLTASNIFGNVTIVLPGTANIDIVGNVVGNTVSTNVLVASGNVTANVFAGSGSQLTGVLSTLPTNANIDIVGNVLAPGDIVIGRQLIIGGNVTAAYFLGNGATLTGISTTLQNANIDIVGNVTAPGNVSVSGQVNVVGNVSGNYFLGNGALLLGVLTSMPTSGNIDIIGNVVAPGNVTVSGQVNVTGNVVANYFLGNGALLEGLLTALPGSANIDIVGNVTAPGNIGVSGQVNVVGNVAANYFLGNGALLRGVLTSMPTSGNLDINGNVSAPGNVSVTRQVDVTGNMSANYFMGNGTFLQGVLTSVPTTANIDITGDVVAPGNVSAEGQVNVTGNVVANYLLGNGTLLEGILIALPSSSNVDIVGNVEVPGNMIVQGQVNVVGNISANYFFGNGIFLSNVNTSLPSVGSIDIFGNLFSPADVFVEGRANIAGNITSPFYFGNAIFLSNVETILPQIALVDIIGNVTTQGAGNVFAEGQVNVVGNVVGPFFEGNGSLLTDVTTALPPVASFDIAGNVSAPGNVVVSGQVTTAGNVSANYFIGNGSQLVGISQALLGVANVDIIGNVSAPGNISVSGQVNVVGNISANYFIGNGSFLDNVLKTFPGSANIDINGNVVSGAFANVGNLSALAGNISNVIIESNVTARYFFGNGSQLTGVLVNVPSTANIDITGNLTGVSVTTGNLLILGNIIAGNLTAATGNISGDYLIGNGYFVEYPGIFIYPNGNVANQTARLALTGIPAGSLVTQDDTNTQYLLTTLPASTSSNWIQFDTAFPTVTSVFNRVGAVAATVGDYDDSKINLSSSVGPIPVTANVSNVLSSLYSTRANIISGVVSSPFFFGNVTSTGNVNASNVTTRLVRVNGNANITGQVNVIGNAYADYLYGNGLFLTGVTFPYPTQAFIDIIGNVSAPGNVMVSGQVNVVGNVTASSVSSGRTLSGGMSSFSDTVRTNELDIWLLTLGQTSVGGQVNVRGNVVSYGTMFGNLENNNGNVIGNVFVGNVISTGNVDSAVLSANILRVQGNSFVSGSVIVGGDLRVSGNATITGNMIVNGNLFLTNLPTINPNDQGNYRPLYVDVRSNVMTEYPIAIPSENIAWFANVNNSFGNVGLMFTYKDTLFASGRGFLGPSNYAYGYLAINVVPAPVMFPGITPAVTGIKTVVHDSLNAAVLTTDGRVFWWGVASPTGPGFVPLQQTFGANPIDKLYYANRRLDFSSVTFNGLFAAIDTTGRLYMWGTNNVGQLGRGNVGASIFTPAIPNGLASAVITEVALSQSDIGSVAAIAANGRIFTWGMNVVGELGLGNTSTTGITVPSIVSTNISAGNVTDVVFGGVATSTTASRQSMRVLLSNGTTFAAGFNSNGELGIGSTTTVTTLQRETTNLSNVAGVGTIGTYQSAHYAILGNGRIRFSGNTIAYGRSVVPYTQTTFTESIGNIGTYAFQGAMLANVGTPSVTTPKIKWSSSTVDSDRIAVYVLDRTGNLHASGYNGSGNFGDGTLANVTTGFETLNSYFPPGNSIVVDFAATGNPNLSNVECGTIVSVADGTMLAAGTNQYGSVPNTYVPNDDFPAETRDAFWSPIIGRLYN
jgi:alpha-tubulin suppressor-like RCC1 family protein/cytoskeletal protein CcmA (bactofilin family)